MDAGLLTVMCGPPGAGKSTWIKQHAGVGAIVLSTEIVRQMSRQMRRFGPNQLLLIKQAAPEHLGRGELVVVEACSTRPGDRADWLQIAHRAGSPTRLVIVDTDIDVCISRQIGRGRSAVPDEIVRMHGRYFEQSRARIPNEGWDEIIWVTGESA